MNKIHTPGTNPQEETIVEKKTVVSDNTWAALEESLSQTPLTTDQRIDQLTGEVRNLTNGLNQLLELSKIMMKSQIESSSALVPFIQSMVPFTQSVNNNLNAITQYQKDNKQTLDILLKTEKDKEISKDLMNWLQNYGFGYNETAAKLAERVTHAQNINLKDRSWYTLLDYFIAQDEGRLIEHLLMFPEIKITDRNLNQARDYPRVLELLKRHINNKR